MIRELKCMTCKYYTDPDDYALPTCKAFPKGIPLKLLYEEVDHEKPYPGDNGIRYEPIEEDK